MIVFDTSKVRIEHVYLKSCTTALGGSVTIVTNPNTDQKEKVQRIEVSDDLVRQFQKLHKVSKYYKPVLTAIMYYGDYIIAIERHAAVTGEEVTDGLTGPRVWKPEMEKNLTDFILPLVGKQTWYFDGKYIFHFEKEIGASVKGGSFLTADGKFRSVSAAAIKLANISQREKLEAVERDCVAYVAANGKYAITPPIWKALNLDDVHPFDTIDNEKFVNLSWVLKAGKDVGKLFGYQAIQPLQLPELMVRLKTVNLPNVGKSVKSTYNSGMKFTHAMSWMIGLANRVDNVGGYITIRGLLKYLTTKGTFRSDTLQADKLFRPGISISDVVMISVEEAKENSSKIDTSKIFKTGKKSSIVESSYTGGLYGAD